MWNEADTPHDDRGELSVMGARHRIGRPLILRRLGMNFDIVNNHGMALNAGVVTARTEVISCLLDTSNE